MRQSGQAPQPGVRPIRLLLPTFNSPLYTMTLQPPLTFLALKRKPVGMGKRAARVPSIAGWFFPLPELPSAGDSVALAVCHRPLVAARASPAALYGNATSVRVGSPPLQVG